MLEKNVIAVRIPSHEVITVKYENSFLQQTEKKLHVHTEVKKVFFQQNLKKTSCTVQ